MQRLPEARLQPTRGLGFLKRRDQIRERAVVHAAAALRRGDGDLRGSGSRGACGTRSSMFDVSDLVALPVESEKEAA